MARRIAAPIGAASRRLGMVLLAATALHHAAAAAAATQAPRIRQDGGVAYVDGGATPLQCSQALGLGREMNLGLAFQYGPDAAALSDVRLTLTDEFGQTVLDLDSAGPLVFAQLEPGRYRARASVRGVWLRREVQIVGDERQQVVLTFPASAAPLIGRGAVWPCRP